MANPSVTFTFANGTTIDAGEHNTNNTDLINAMTDGSKSFSIDALTIAGAGVFNGAVTLGNSVADDIKISGSIAATINIKTNDSFDFGSATKGLKALYFGDSSDTIAITAPTLAASYTITLPKTGGADNDTIYTNGSGTLTFSRPGSVSNLGLESAQTSVANDSIKITGSTGADLSSTNVLRVKTQGATAGQTTIHQLISNVTIDLTGAHWSLGTHGDTTDTGLHVYVINDGGADKWGVSLAAGLTKIAQGDSSATQTNITAGGDMLVNTGLGAGTHPCLEVGFFKANLDDTGGSSEDLWVVQTAIDDINVGIKEVDNSEIKITTGNGQGSTNTTIRRFSTVLVNTGSAVTLVQSAADGDHFLINKAGMYRLTYQDANSASQSDMGISLNSTQLATSVSAINAADRKAFSVAATNISIQISTVEELQPGDILRAHGDTGLNESTIRTVFRIVRISD